MNPTRLITLATLALASSLPLAAQAPAAAAPVVPPGNTRASPHETVSARVGGRNLVTITYGRPYMKGRKVWGELVKFDKGDRLGADEATTFLTQVPLVIGDTTIPAGVYTLYIVASATGANKLAFSSNLGKWGIPVDETKDVARVELKKETLEAPIEQLSIGIAPNPPDGGTIVIAWENTKFSLPFTVKK